MWKVTQAMFGMMDCRFLKKLILLVYLNTGIIGGKKHTLFHKFASDEFYKLLIKELILILKKYFFLKFSQE